MKHTIFDPKTNRDVVVDRPDDWQPEVIQPKAPPKTKQELEKLVVEARDELFKDVDSALAELKEEEIKPVLNITTHEDVQELSKLEEKLETVPLVEEMTIYPDGTHEITFTPPSPPTGVRMIPITGMFQPIGFSLPSMDAPSFNIEKFKTAPPEEEVSQE